MELPENLSGLAPSAKASESASAIPNAAMPSQPMSGQQATPQEQENYETFVSMALMMLFDEKTLPTMVSAVDTEDPREGVAKLTGQLVNRVAQTAFGKGTVFSTAILINGSAEIFENVIDFAEAAGVYEFSSDAKMLQGAMVRAFDHVQDLLDKNGLIDEAEIEAGFDEIQAAAADGSLTDRLGVAGADLEAVDPGDGLGLDAPDEEEEEAVPPDEGALAGGLG